MYPDEVTDEGVTALCVVIILYALDFLHHLGVVHTDLDLSTVLRSSY